MHPTNPASTPIYNEFSGTMFSTLNASSRQRPSLPGWASVAAHLLFLAWLVFPPRPIFIAPVSIQRGDNGSSLTPIYFDSQFSEQAAASPQPAKASRRARAASSHMTFAAKQKAAAQPRVNANAPSEAKADAGESLAKQAPPAGSPFGSLMQGTLFGQEVRPALPVVSPDPVFGSEDLARISSGDVVIEITINERGEITDKIVVQSLTHAIDARVLAALEKWQFRPATRNGVPIPSKQDVHYHFPR